jgi:hypothetical protein
MRALDDDRLLESLGEALMSDPALLDDDERAVLHRALGAAPADSAGPRASRGLRALRRPAAAGVAAVIILSGGAAAAVETDTLPAPLRGIASSLGLPASPSSLAQAQSAVADLSRALAARDPAATRAALTSLLSALPELSASDRAQLGPMVAELIAEAEIFLAGDSTKSSSNRRSASSGRDPNTLRDSASVGDADDVARSTAASTDELDTGGPTGEAPGTPESGMPSAPATTDGDGQPDGATSGSTGTTGSNDGGGSGGNSTTPVSSGPTTTDGGGGSDGGSGSSMSQPTGSDGPDIFNTNTTTGSDGSGGSDGGTSGSDGGSSGAMPH